MTYFSFTDKSVTRLPKTHRHDDTYSSTQQLEVVQGRSMGVKTITQRILLNMQQLKNQMDKKGDFEHNIESVP